MRRFAVAQRVFVVRDGEGALIDLPGTVTRLRRLDNGAWIELDQRHERCPFPADDERRSRHLVAYPEDCTALKRGAE